MIFFLSFFGSFVIIVISYFGFEGWIWVLIDSVPGLCILFTFKNAIRHIVVKIKA